MKLGKYLIVLLLIGIITVLLLTFYIENPPNLTKEVSTTRTNTTTVNEIVWCQGMPHITWEMYVGLVSHRETLNIDSGGSASFWSPRNGYRPEEVKVNAMLNRSEFAELCSIMTRINFTTLKAPFVNASGWTFDAPVYHLTIESTNASRIHRFFDWDSRNYYVPNELLDLKNRLENITNKLYSEAGTKRFKNFD